MKWPNLHESYRRAYPGGFDPSAYPEPFASRYRTHLQHLKLKGLQPKTIDAYARTIRRMSQYFDHQINALSSAQLTNYFNETMPSGPERPLHCRFLGSQTVSLVGPSQLWKAHSLRLPEDLQGVDLAVPGPRHAVRAQFDALCVSAGVTPRLRAEVDDMAMLRLIARDSGWLTVLPDVVVQDELRSVSLVNCRAACTAAITVLRHHHTTPPQNAHCGLPAFHVADRSLARRGRKTR